jgi:hypothetical protein
MKPGLLTIVLFLLAAAIMTFGLFACAKSGGGFVTALERSASTAKDTDNPTVTISSVTDFEWDTLFIFPPFTPVDRIHAQLGYKWSDAAKTHIDASDGFHLLVFVKSGTVVHHFKVSRQIDFQNLEVGNVFSPRDDVFEIKAAGAGETKRLNFVPKRKGQPNSK